MYKKLARLAVGAGSAIAVWGFIAVTRAADFGLPTPGNTSVSSDANANDTINGLASSVIGIVFLIGGVLAVGYLLWSGIQYITAGGNADRVKAARQGIINAVIGIIILFAAFFIVRFAVGIGNTVSNTNTTN